MDIRLAGGRDGVDAAKELFTTMGVPSIFATAHADQETRCRAEEARDSSILAISPLPVVAAFLAVVRARSDEKSSGQPSHQASAGIPMTGLSIRELRRLARGFVYLAVVIDRFSSKVSGYQVSNAVEHRDSASTGRSGTMVAYPVDSGSSIYSGYAGLMG
jgi:hypothetical protein